MAGKRTAARVGLKVGRRVGPKAGKYVGKAALKAGKAQAKLVRSAMSSKEPRSSRFLKYGVFALIGFAVGALVARSGRDDNGSSNTTGHHTPDAGSPAGRRGETWGSGTPLGGSGAGTAHQSPSEANRTGADRDYSDPSSGPLIGEQHNADAGDVPEQQEEVENRIRTRIGEDERTRDLPRVNVEVNDGIVELRGTAPDEQTKLAVGEIAAETEGVSEVRNLIQVS